MISSETVASEDIVPWIAPQLLVDEQLAADEDEGKVDLEFHLAELEKTREAAFAAGLQQGQAEVQDQGEREKACLSQLIEALQRPLADFDSEVNAELLRFAMSLTRRMLKRELESDAQYYNTLIRRLCEEYGLNTRSATVSMHPDDVALLQTGLADEERKILPRLVADESLSRGSCLVDAGQFFVNAGVDALVDKIAFNLKADFETTLADDEQE